MFQEEMSGKKSKYLWWDEKKTFNFIYGAKQWG